MKIVLHCALLGALSIAALAAAQAQTPALPTERVGVSGKELAAIKLPPGFDTSKGRTLRMREVTIMPGGTLPMHGHTERPSVSYVLKGTLTEWIDGEAESRTIAAGQSYATHLKGHALQNRGEVPVTFIEIDLP